MYDRKIKSFFNFNSANEESLIFMTQLVYNEKQVIQFTPMSSSPLQRLPFSSMPFSNIHLYIFKDNNASIWPLFLLFFAYFIII